MGVFDSRAFDDHEQVVFGRDVASGLRALIAIHDRSLGPALGGCRYLAYRGEQEALDDVLRLSRGMTYKNALAGLSLGGGKAVILAEPGRPKTPALLHAFGRLVDSLGGRYITAEDVGIGQADVDVIGQQTAHVSGHAGGTGDPAPMTALGVFVGIQAAVCHVRGVDDLEGVRVAVQGLGNVGRRLCALLHQAGARLVVCDLDDGVAAEWATSFGGEWVPAQAIYDQPVEVLAPCALGAVVSPATLPRLRARVVAGAANNQLASDDMDRALRDRGILYAPDYVINAGGVIDIAGGLSGPLASDAERKEQVARIGRRLASIFEQASREGRGTAEVADVQARAILAAAPSA